MKTYRFRSHGIRFIADGNGLKTANDVYVNAPNYIEAVTQALRIYNVLKYECPAYVYFAKSCNADSLYKIGYSANPVTRTRSQFTELLQLWGFRRGKDALAFESYLLEKYDQYRQHWNDTDKISEWVILPHKDAIELIETPSPLIHNGVILNLVSNRKVRNLIENEY